MAFYNITCILQIFLMTWINTSQLSGFKYYECRDKYKFTNEVKGESYLFATMG